MCEEAKLRHRRRLARDLKYAAGRSLAREVLHVKGQTARYTQSIVHQISSQLAQASGLGGVAARLHAEQLHVCPPDASKFELVPQGLEKFSSRMPRQGTVALGRHHVKMVMYLSPKVLTYQPAWQARFHTFSKKQRAHLERHFIKFRKSSAGRNWEAWRRYTSNQTRKRAAAAEMGYRLGPGHGINSP